MPALQADWRTCWLCTAAVASTGAAGPATAGPAPKQPCEPPFAHKTRQEITSVHMLPEHSRHSIYRRCRWKAAQQTAPVLSLMQVLSIMMRASALRVTWPVQLF